MSDLIAPVKDGKVEEVETSNSKKEEKAVAGGNLGKEEFLQLLVAQMQYQDPLEPNTDTEYVSQLAQFSSLEQMQNLNTTMSNSAALGYVGQTVTVSHEDSSGNTNEVQGVVEYVKMQNGTAYVSIDDKLYKAEEVTSVIDTSYLALKKAPTVEQTSLDFSHTDPTTQKIYMSLGEDEGAATAVVVAIDDNAVDSKFLDYDMEKGILSIDKEAFSYLDAGKYSITFVFNDALSTTVTDKVSLTVTGIKPQTASTDDNLNNTDDTEDGQDNENSSGI